MGMRRIVGGRSLTLLNGAEIFAENLPEQIKGPYEERSQCSQRAEWLIQSNGCISVAKIDKKFEILGTKLTLCQVPLTPLLHTPPAWVNG